MIMLKIYYSPNLAFNLVSVSDLLRLDYEVEFSKNVCKILNRHKKCLISIPKGHDNLYSIDIEQLRNLTNDQISNSSNIIKCVSSISSNMNNNARTQNDNEIKEIVAKRNNDNSGRLGDEFPLFIADAKDVDATELLHRRLCHAHVNGIISSIRNKCFTGINVDVKDLNPNYFCDICPL